MAKRAKDESAKEISESEVAETPVEIPIETSEVEKPKDPEQEIIVDEAVQI